MRITTSHQFTFVAHNTHEILFLRMTQHVFFQVLFLLERRIASLVLALERAILAVDVLDVNLQFGAGGEARRTLVAVIVLDLEVTLQMLFDVLLFERA